ncbi:hypothetical protein HF908_01180 [Ralstonia pseudosolanacearum]|uniref:hypothetical protein n=1 Tax=Ralstonia pseudosolanacearum TaxID=1310165 RepID=UPI00186957CA|nr:hypothetical protein [Ralstonia pseudosolanacearum]QOK90242.1 hypothetical protein HF908_01180 [Ralstonia pseudosolanacearum]
MLATIAGRAPPRPSADECGTPLMLQATTQSYRNPIQALQASAAIFNKFSFIEFIAAPHMQPI